MSPDYGTIENFLHRIGERKRHHLAVIHPDRAGLEGSTYELAQVPALLKHIDLKQRFGFGVYYSLNEGVEVYNQRGFNGKLLADEIVRVHMMGFDIDWIKGDQSERYNFQQAALGYIFNREGVKPDIMVSSGGGLQALFVFGKDIPVALSRTKVPSKEQGISDTVSKHFRDELARLYKDIVLEIERWIEPLITTGAAKVDQLGNIDRVFRMPGTVNYPTQAKIEKGATTQLARIVYDEGTVSDFLETRELVPAITAPLERKEKKPFSERPDKKWTVYNKAVYLCDFIRDKRLVEDNEAYTHALMFPLMGMINRDEITKAQGRELWLNATSTARDPAHGSWTRKWDTRKIENYTGRDIGSIVHYVRQHGCLLPWSTADEDKKTDLEVEQIRLDSLRNPSYGSRDDLTNF